MYDHVCNLLKKDNEFIRDAETFKAVEERVSGIKRDVPAQEKVAEQEKEEESNQEALREIDQMTCQ